MLIKKLIALCKKSGLIIVYNTEDGTQWLSDGHAIFPVYKDFEFNSYSLCDIYDIDKDKVAKHDMTGLPALMSGADRVPDETECEVLPIKIYRNGDVHIALETKSGIAFIRQRILSPLSDTASSDILFFERKTEAGPVYAAKVGMQLAALILPTEIIDDNFVRDIKMFASLCEHTKERKDSAL